MNWYKKSQTEPIIQPIGFDFESKNIYKAAGAEDMLGGMIEEDVRRLNIPEEDLTEDQIKKIRDISCGT